MPLLDGTRSLKAALDCDWDDPVERTAALEQVLVTLDTVEHQLAVPSSGASGGGRGARHRPDGP